MASADRSSSSVDVLRWPVVGALLRWRHARTTLQLAALLIATAIVLHGLFGPQIAPRNLATVLTWVHYRGLLVVALLAAGNFFCTGCPFILVRDAARRQHRPARAWPARLRNKWVGIALFASVLFVYELFDLWALPRATAWLVLGYFAAALAIDLVFTGAAFCKYLCPIGQFNFAAATLSPLAMTVRRPEICGTCRTVDCIRGRRDPAAPGVTIQRGCELGLFLPAKIGNLDCTFCLDCVQACPHDNVAIAARLPGAELVDGRRRSGIGRLAARTDIAALAVVFAFGALLNAFAMARPVYEAEQRLARMMGVSSEAPVLLLMFVVGLGIGPAVLLMAAAASSRLLSRPARGSIRADIVNYAVALVPVGFGLWIAHYAFHLLTGVLTIVPVTQSAAADLFGRALFGAPLWTLAGMRPGAVFPLQIGFVMLGAFGSLAAAYGISEREQPARPVAAAMPWLVLVLLLAAAAVWVLSRPMEMRGSGFAG
jgi:polyferredoxin